MRAEFYKKHAEDILSNLESIRATFKELVDSNKIAPKSYKDSTPGTNDVYSCKFKEVQDDFINLVHAFDQEMPFYKNIKTLITIPTSRKGTSGYACSFSATQFSFLIFLMHCLTT